jgi:hypothetical protein
MPRAWGWAVNDCLRKAVLTVQRSPMIVFTEFAAGSERHRSQ